LKILKAVLICGLCLLLSGCAGEPSGSTMEQIQNRLLTMQDYSAKGTLTRYGSREEEFEIEQFYRGKDGAYRLNILSPEKLAGNYTVFDGRLICQYNPHVSETPVCDVPDSPHRNELFISSFIKNYFRSEEVAAVSASLDEAKCTVLEAVIPGDNERLASEKLWIDNDSLKPKKLAVYDRKGNEVYILNFSEFEYDPTLDPALFETGMPKEASVSEDSLSDASVSDASVSEENAVSEAAAEAEPE